MQIVQCCRTLDGVLPGLEPPGVRWSVILLVAVALAGCGGDEGPVAPSNRAPEPRNSIPAHELHAGEQVTLDLSHYFRDPDGDALTYTAASSAAAVVSVSVSGTALTVIGVSLGSARVTVSASDPAGQAATQSFEVTVSNRAPEPRDSIPDQALHAGEQVTLDLSPYFSDPDSDVLTYAAASSAAAVVSVSVSGTALTVTGVAVGSARVTVSASDPAGQAATQAFEATVSNRAPEPRDSIPDQALHAGEQVTLDLSPYFSDPDGDALTYTAASSAAAVESVSVSGTALTVTGVAVGSAWVTVSASDPAGQAATQSFEVTVSNRAPEPRDSIPDQALHAGEQVTIDLSPYFRDPDGDVLTYAAASSAAAVASVSVSGAALTVTGVSPGSARVTVTASDPAGATATQAFEVSVTVPGPDLVFTGVSPPSITLGPGESATFSFLVRNQGTVASAATTVRAMRSSNPIISVRDAEIRSYSLPPLAPSQDRLFRVTVSINPKSAAGTIYVGMCADAVPGESDTRNNCSEAARLTVVKSM